MAIFGAIVVGIRGEYKNVNNEDFLSGYCK